ncbi:MAG TPA: hypothetical protein EYP65_08390, partial [Armatimonadetes bacterium]|nr:hypothetical protein [Armatimonadota bacterium]
MVARMKIRRAGALAPLTVGSVPDMGLLLRLFRRRRKFASPSALEAIIERIEGAVDSKERRVAEELLMEMELNPYDGRAALVLSRCIMGGGRAASACLRKLASMPHCPLKDALLDCVIRSLKEHRTEAKEA